MLLMQYNLFYPLNQLRWAKLFQGLQILMRVPSNNPMQPWNCGSYVTKIQHFLIMGHWISSIMAELMQDAIKMPSSVITFLLQFHKNASYLVTLSCFIYNMMLSKRCFGINLDGCPKMWCGSSMDLTWPMMVGIVSYANSSNSIKLKLVKDLKKLGMACMVIKTFCTPMLRSTNCAQPSSNCIGVKNSQVLTHAIVACTIIWCSTSILPPKLLKSPKGGSQNETTE